MKSSRKSSSQLQLSFDVHPAARRTEKLSRRRRRILDMTDQIKRDVKSLKEHPGYGDEFIAQRIEEYRASVLELEELEAQRAPDPYADEN